LAQTLNYLGVDTLIVMGATACACVRHTVMDSTGYGFKTLIPEGTIGDRVPGVVEWNMFDMEAKFADVLTVDEVVEYLESIDNSVYTKPARKLDKELVTK
jgi:maleamate amidohydrolase